MNQLGEAIGVVRGASNAEIQEILCSLAERWREEIRLAGVVAESHGLPDRFCQAGYLRSLATGRPMKIVKPAIAPSRMVVAWFKSPWIPPKEGFYQARISVG